MPSESAAAAALPARTLHMRPLAISAGLREALARTTAVVLTAHRLGASLAVAGCEDAVFMSAPGSGLLPSHIVVRARELHRVLEAMASRTDPALSLRVGVNGVRTFLAQLTENPAGMRSTHAQANITALAQSLRASSMQLGLGASAAELLAHSAHWSDCLYPTSGGRHALESRLRSLIGRGSGTTPAGDDFVVGMLAYTWSTLGQRAPLIQVMRTIVPDLGALTTTTGATYLRAATRGEFGSHLIAWVRALPRARRAHALRLAQRIAGHGATSGYDTLTGFVAAAEAAPDYAGG